MITNHLHLFSSVDSLKTFIETSIPDSPKLMVQLFFASSDHDMIDAVRSTLARELPSAHIIGSTTDGVVMENRTLYRETVIAFTRFEKSSLSHLLLPFESGTEQQAAAQICDAVVSEKTKVLILFADGLHCNGELLIRSIDALYPEVVIAGGLAGDNAEFAQTVVCDNTAASSCGIAALAIDSDDLVVHTQYKLDWHELGKEMTITRCEGNRVYTIDDLTALEVYHKYLGDAAAEGLPNLGIEFPLIVSQNGIKMARPPFHIHEDGSLSFFAGGFEEGQKVRLGIGNPEQIVSSGNVAYQELKDKPVEAIFIYSCMARRRFLLENINYELQTLNRIAPLAGFYTYGEFYSSEHSKDLLNQTLTVLALSEENRVTYVETEIPEKPELSSATKTLNALVHLVTETTNEIGELNRSLEERVAVKTAQLETLNQQLEQRIDQEVARRIEHEQMLFQQSRLAGMGEMLDNIAHQWRQPLMNINAVLMNIGRLYELGRLDQNYFEKKLDEITLQTSHMSNTIEDFRNFFRIDKAKTSFSLLDAINEVFSLMKSALKEIDVTLSGEEDIEISAYRGELLQVLLAIINNAVEIFNIRGVRNRQIRLHLAVDNGAAEISITDNAGGIENQYIDKVFDPYFTTKHQAGGTGLGLYTSKLIVKENFGGLLHARNRDGGACFTITLPMDEAPLLL